MKQVKQPLQKITVHVPKYLLEAALKATHKNITDTVREALEDISTKKALKNIQSMRGQFNFDDLNIGESREDR